MSSHTVDAAKAYHFLELMTLERIRGLLIDHSGSQINWAKRPDLSLWQDFKTV